MTCKINFFLFAVKSLHELTAASLGLGKLDQTPEVLYIRKQDLQVPSQVFLYHSSKSFSVFPHPFPNHGHVPVTCAVNRGNTICLFFEIPFFTTCYHVSPSLESRLPRILYSVLEVRSTYFVPQHITLCFNSECDFTRGLRMQWLPINLAKYEVCTMPGETVTPAEL